MEQPELESLAGCPLCGTTDFSIVLQGPDYFLHQPGTFQYVACQQCSLIYQNPRPTSAAIGAYYPDSYGTYSQAKRGIRGQHPLIRAMIMRVQRQRGKRLVEALPTMHGVIRKVLDIGAGSGFFLEAMQTFPNWRPEGVELNAKAAEAIAQRLQIPVFAGRFEDADFDDASFDAITLWDVLEHLHDPLAGLGELYRILKPGGVLYVRVPNATSYARKLAGRYWVGYDLPRHMTLFSQATLTAMVEQTGFAPPEKVFKPNSYLSLVHSLEWRLKDRGVAPGQIRLIQRLLANPLSRLMTRPFVWIADTVGGSSSLEVIIRKPFNPQQG